VVKISETLKVLLWSNARILFIYGMQSVVGCNTGIQAGGNTKCGIAVWTKRSWLSTQASLFQVSGTMWRLPPPSRWPIRRLSDSCRWLDESQFPTLGINPFLQGRQNRPAKTAINISEYCSVRC